MIENKEIFKFSSRFLGWKREFVFYHGVVLYKYTHLLKRSSGETRISTFDLTGEVLEATRFGEGSFNSFRSALLYALVASILVFGFNNEILDYIGYFLFFAAASSLIGALFYLRRMTWFALETHSGCHDLAFCVDRIISDDSSPVRDKQTFLTVYSDYISSIEKWNQLKSNEYFNDGVLRVPAFDGFPGKLIELCVSKGQKVSTDDMLAVIETDLLVLELPSPCSGVVTEIKVSLGDAIEAGDELFSIDALDQGSSGSDPLIAP